jgi:hypothetical protein
MITNKFTIKAFDTNTEFKDNLSIGSARNYKIDLSPWAEENGNITSATWTVKRGSASVSNKTLSSNVVNALITFNSAETNLIKIELDTGAAKKIVWLTVRVYNPEDNYVRDYDF